MDFKQATATWWDAITSGFGRQDGLELDVLGLVLVIGIPLVVTVTPGIWRFFGRLCCKDWRQSEVDRKSVV